jgi:4'-phosphopantetheinyl transferase
MNISKINPDDEMWQAYLSEKRAEKVQRLKKQNKKAQSIGAELLLNFAANGDTRKKVKWDTDEMGKLYLTEHDGLYVNLSHSKDYAVCAVHDKPIGADIQFCRECDMKMAQRFFSPNETEFINGSKDRKSAFFEIWTKKESLVKAVGKGLAIPLGSFSVLGSQTEYGGNVYRFKEYTVSKSGYKLFVCYSV